MARSALLVCPLQQRRRTPAAQIPWPVSRLHSRPSRHSPPPPYHHHHNLCAAYRAETGRESHDGTAPSRPSSASSRTNHYEQYLRQQRPQSASGASSARSATGPIATPTGGDKAATARQAAASAASAAIRSANVASPVEIAVAAAAQVAARAEAAAKAAKAEARARAEADARVRAEAEARARSEAATKAAASAAAAAVEAAAALAKAQEQAQAAVALTQDTATSGAPLGVAASNAAAATEAPPENKAAEGRGREGGEEGKDPASEREYLEKLLVSTRPKDRSTTDFYSFGKVVGTGSFAKVRVARHKLTGQLVAIKTYEKAKIKDSNQLKRIQSEIKVMEKMDHPLVSRFFETIESARRIHLVMEFLGEGRETVKMYCQFFF